MGYQSAARMILAVDAAKMHYPDLIFTLDVNLLRTVLSKLWNGTVVLKRKQLNEIIEIISSAERDHEKISLGGIILLLYPYVNQMKEGQFSFGENVFFGYQRRGIQRDKRSHQG